MGIPSSQAGPAIEIGYPWQIRLSVRARNGGTAPAVFPVGCSLQAHVRAERDSDVLLADLTTGNGGIIWVSETEIDLVLTDVQTADMPAGSVVMDFVRTDLAPHEHLRITLGVPVETPITRTP